MKNNVRGNSSAERSKFFERMDSLSRSRARADELPRCVRSVAWLTHLVGCHYRGRQWAGTQCSERRPRPVGTRVVWGRRQTPLLMQARSWTRHANKSDSWRSILRLAKWQVALALLPNLQSVNWSTSDEMFVYKHLELETGLEVDTKAKIPPLHGLVGPTRERHWRTPRRTANECAPTRYSIRCAKPHEKGRGDTCLHPSADDACQGWSAKQRRRVVSWSRPLNTSSLGPRDWQLSPCNSPSRPRQLAHCHVVPHSGPGLHSDPGRPRALQLLSYMG